MVVGRLKRMIVRNSATCVHCGEVMGCTHIDPQVWVTHRCDDATFAIRGGNQVSERSGSLVDYDDTSVYQNVIALSCVYNAGGDKFFLPEESAA